MQRLTFFFLAVLCISTLSTARESLLSQMKTYQAERQSDSEAQLRAFDAHLKQKDAEEAQARAQAQKELALNTVKQMYAQSRRSSSDDMIFDYADNALKQAFSRGCAGYNVMWQTNGDKNIDDPVKFTQLSANTIQAKLYDNSLVKYKMNCSADSCRVADVSDRHMKSLKSSLNMGCEYD